MQRHCRLVNGSSYPDLAGIGVRTASNLLVVFPKVMSRSFPLMAGSWDSHFSSGPFFSLTISLSYRGTPISCWPKQHHETCIWSQLLFTIALLLGCLVVQYQESAGIYQTVVMMNAAIITLTCLILTVSSFYRPSKRVALFSFSTVAVFAFSLMTAFTPAIIGHMMFDNILLVCRNVANAQNLSWSRGVVQPYDNNTTLPRQLSNFALIPFLMES